MLKYLAKKPFLVSFVIALIVFLTLHFLVKIESAITKGAIAGAIGGILAPKRTKIDTQIGERTQIKWFLLKEPMFIDK